MTVSVSREDLAGTRHRVKIRQHSFTVDTSVAGGGNDEGPSPHDLYDASLASCKALTVLLYAKRKGMPLENIEVQVERDDSQERQGTYKLKAVLHLSGALDDAQRAELLRVAGKCPVHRLMTEVKTEVETVLA